MGNNPNVPDISDVRSMVKLARSGRRGTRGSERGHASLNPLRNVDDASHPKSPREHRRMEKHHEFNKIHNTSVETSIELLCHQRLLPSYEDVN
jgi:hypothetical protein